MLNHKKQHLKIITVAFSVFVFLGLMAPFAFASSGQDATDASQILFTNEIILNGKKMIVETRIYEAPVVVQNQNTVTDETFIWPTTGNLSQGYHKGHYAYDIADKSKPPVWAAGAGTVIKVMSDCENISYGCGGGYGNYIKIDHGNGLTTLYAKLDSVAVNVGDVVKKGDVIGKMGRSGNVRGLTGIHLHFEVIKDGKKQNPSDYFVKN